MFAPWLHLFADLASAQVEANEIIARRMIGFATSSAKGKLANDPELTRMVIEKWAAAASGTAAIPAAVMTALAVPPENMVGASASVARAAVTPALVRLKANNRRLRRKRP